MTQDILRGDGATVDTAGFEACMNEQRTRAREARKSGGGPTVISSDASSRFVGDGVYQLDSKVLALAVDGEERKHAEPGDLVQIVTAETPFYGESGGQVGDRGTFETAGGTLVEIDDTIKPRPDLTVHVGVVERGTIEVGADVTQKVDRERRDATRLNHSVTHILHAVLRRVLGPHVQQAGSMVAPDRLRFDFSQPGPVSADDLARIEKEVNQHIRENAAVADEEMAFDDAIKAGALAFFGDKYGDVVRVVRMGDFSTELCGGTHVSRTGDIGLFKLRGESGIAAGTRRVEAVTGAGAMEWVRAAEDNLKKIGELLRGGEEEVAARLEKLLGEQRQLEKQLEQLRRKMAGNQSSDLLEKVREVGGRKVIATEIETDDPKRLREIADQLRDRLGSGVVVLATRQEGEVRLLAAVTKDLAKQVHAGKLIGEIAPIVGGKGGGRPDMAQAGGKDPGKIAEALERAVEILS
jgi:alanyl-tRNA synthetase